MLILRPTCILTLPCIDIWSLTFPSSVYITHHRASASRNFLASSLSENQVQARDDSLEVFTWLGANILYWNINIRKLSVASLCDQFLITCRPNFSVVWWLIVAKFLSLIWWLLYILVIVRFWCKCLCLSGTIIKNLLTYLLTWRTTV